MNHSTPYKILVVDDVDANRFAIELALADMDAELLFANSGEAALEMLMRETEVPALALIDVQMPGIDGYELARLIRGNVRLRHVPIIFLSAIFRDIEHIFTGYESGAVDYITKPFSSAVLQAKARIFLDLHRYRRESVQAEISKREAVAKSEERLNAVMHVTREAIWDWHVPSGHMVHNRQWYDMLGLQEGEIADTLDAFAALIHPDEKPLVMQRMDALLHGERDSYQSEHRMVGKLDTIWVQDRGGVVERDEQGHPVRVVGSFGDITGRRRTEAELRQSHDEWQRTFDAMEDLVFITDDQHNVLRINKATSTVLGITEDQAKSIPCYALVCGHDKPPENCPHRQTMKDHGTHRLDIRVERLGQHFQVTTSPILDAEGNCMATVHVAHDISERIRYEHELEEARRVADAANRAKSEFLSNMSHEILTPMNGVLGMAQLLVMPEIQDDKRIQYAQTILHSGRTLQSLLNDILDLSKVEAGKLKLESIAFAVDTLIGDKCALFAESANAKGLQLDSTWHGPAGACYLGDPHRLRQMLSNLVSNAIKFTDHGLVHIVVSEIERQSQHAVLEFSVSDSGIGITPQQQALLFLPFSQADSSTTRQFGGSGLGLSIVARLAQLMEGEVGIESQPGHGSRFWFRVRVLIQPGAQESPQTAATAVSVGDLTGTVLLVEDNAVNQMVIMAMLGELNCSGVRVTEVEDGQQALDFVTQGGAPDLVLMDVQMPVMGGLEATEKIRLWQAEHGKPRLPIVALTANAFKEDRQKCMDSGMDDFLAKPIDLQKLQATLVRWLGGKLLVVS